ncbi:MAG: hypothetical protein HOQ30_15355 [Gemmatimonadaceae bacterium]|nr:hypothetical protein [Gemmatimonadaceae bacterium]NUQ91295.1 hypothetical protein [Gemmatimonadaceae bacterium]NUR35381.1 hypothetical protein [Gemmatimonadaceae bacterium]
MLRTIAIAAALSAALASHAAAQDVAQDVARDSVARSNVLATVVVTAQPTKPNVFSRAWHMQEDRVQVLAMMDENRRLASQLRGYDKQVARLEHRLGAAKATHDQKVAAIAATDSLTADTHRRRLELEAKLRQLEGASVATGPTAPAEPR